ncbi:MAG TPA: PIG-L family deacetylase [Anaerolineaceae bacterium]|jgi:LmbE family N-acetylglucosaminyl deacetylase|nr:PIG-L family deacetylase [Anaerolineaceae bacterium]HPS32062.1 PIG-L family deacetylase [Anaerolineaceae bacterium]
MNLEQADNWPAGTTILVVLAHPDDPEFFMGGTIARWTAAGYTVKYALLTRGERGISPEFPDSAALASVRVREQKEAAAVLGVHEVTFFDYQDGYLIPSLEIRREVTRLIRSAKADIVVSCDPQNYFIGEAYLNHPDHRAAGQLVVDAVFPAVGNPSFFPELILDGYPATNVSELWLSLPAQANVLLDVSEFWQQRALALLRHKSQVGDPEKFLAHIEERRLENSGTDDRYVERFRRIIFRK